MPLLTRRSFLPLLAAPAIIRVADLMTIKPLRNEFMQGRLLPSNAQVLFQTEPGHWIGKGDIAYQDSSGYWHKVHAGDVFIQGPMAIVDKVNDRSDVAVGRLLRQGLVKHYVGKLS